MEDKRIHDVTVPEEMPQSKQTMSIVKVVELSLLGICTCSILALAISVPLQDSYRNEAQETMDRTAAKINELEKDSYRNEARETLDRAVAKINELEKITLHGGAVYKRWGRTKCPNDTKTIYNGIVAGSNSSNRNSGGTSTPVCLPDGAPQWGNVKDGEQSSKLYAAEYEMPDTQSNAIFNKSIKDHDVPCVVCEASGRLTETMFPARKICYTGWHLEYSGYLVTAASAHHTLELMCLDANPEVVREKTGSTGALLLYMVEPSGQIPDPEYNSDHELTCVVCTK